METQSRVESWLLARLGTAESAFALWITALSFVLESDLCLPRWSSSIAKALPNIAKTDGCYCTCGAI